MNGAPFSGPDFVHSFEYGDYVFFFFRETAVEYMNCGKRVYSRVARVCKGDRGVDQHRPNGMSTWWSSFLKSRLNCSFPGDYPFYFDEIRKFGSRGKDTFTLHLRADVLLSSRLNWHPLLGRASLPTFSLAGSLPVGSTLTRNHLLAMVPLLAGEGIVGSSGITN